MSLTRSLALIASGVLGASGVAAAAASSHAGADLLGPYALIALTHAPALLALAFRGDTRLMQLASLVLASGALLFCSDLAMRYAADRALFPMSAPLGGFLMMGGWVLVALAGLVMRRQ
jgi:uncharacterized membrane protein YgdD (TMEM256/DUF423 family)